MCHVSEYSAKDITLKVTNEADGVRVVEDGTNTCSIDLVQAHAAVSAIVCVFVQFVGVRMSTGLLPGD